MKKLVSCLMLAIPLMGVCQQKYKISGVIAGVSSKAKMYLVYDKDHTFYKDSCILNSGVFSFSGKLEEAKPATLVLGREGKFTDFGEVDMLSIYLEPSPLKIVGKDSVSKARITGGELNTNNQEKIRLIKNIQGLRYLQEPKLVADFVSRYPASLVSLDWVMSFSAKTSWVANCYAKLALELRQTKAAEEFGLEIQRFLTVAPGKVAPDFSLPDPRGKLIKLSDFKGKYVLLDFWASYCKPCRGAHPELKELYAALQPSGKFEILAVSVDRTKAPWVKAIEDDQIIWPQVADLAHPGQNKAAELYSVSILPSQFLIGPDGRILPLSVLGEIRQNKALPADNTPSMGRLSDLSEASMWAALRKEGLSEAGFKEDFDQLDNLLNTDIGEGALSVELGKFNFPQDSLAIRELLDTKGVSLNKKRQEMKKRFIAAHPNSFISLYLLNEMELMYATDSYVAAFDALADRFKQNAIAEEIKSRFVKYNATARGSLAKNFSRKNQYGKQISLNDYQGKLIILDFWGTWCIPCRQTHPHLKTLYSQYKAKGLEIVAVADEKNKDTEKARAGWLAAIKKDDVNWVHVLNKEGAADQDIVKEYGITSFPTKLLLDKNGKILMRVTGGLNDEMDTMIKSILEN
jgi:thiol-disulfide isomerase/thioredoxin